MTSILIEPSRFHHQVLSGLLKNAGFAVESHSTSQDLLDRLARDRTVHIICLSYHIDDLDGIQLCERIRAIPELSSLPIVLITAHEGSELTERGYTSGVTEIFYKSDLSRFSDYLLKLSVTLRESRLMDGTVLYLEDSPSTASLIKSWLVAAGLRVDHFESGEEGLQAFKQDPARYDVVLSDFMLKGKVSGIGVLREIRTTAGQRLPVLILSSLEDPTRRIEILSSGANDFVAKPALQEELLARLRTLIINKKLFDEVEEQKKRLLQLSMTDQLTGLFNRHSLNELGPRLIAEAKRYKYPLSLIILDIDHFKSINDSHGHQRGDEVLAQVGSSLRSFGREGDYIARYGGEEFVILLPHCALKEGIRRAEDLRGLIGMLKPAELVITISCGVAELKPEDQDYNKLLLQADLALYQAKNTGRNQVVAAE